MQNHVQNTLNKLQLHNRVELARYAIERAGPRPRLKILVIMSDVRSPIDLQVMIARSRTRILGAAATEGEADDAAEGAQDRGDAEDLVVLAEQRRLDRLLVRRRRSARNSCVDAR